MSLHCEVTRPSGLNVTVSLRAVNLHTTSTVPLTSPPITDDTHRASHSLSLSGERGQTALIILGSARFPIVSGEQPFQRLQQLCGKQQQLVQEVRRVRAGELQGLRASKRAEERMPLCALRVQAVRIRVRSGMGGVKTEREAIHVREQRRERTAYLRELPVERAAAHAQLYWVRPGPARSAPVRRARVEQHARGLGVEVQLRGVELGPRAAVPLRGGLRRADEADEGGQVERELHEKVDEELLMRASMPSRYALPQRKESSWRRGSAARVVGAPQSVRSTAWLGSAVRKWTTRRSSCAMRASCATRCAG
ncbi:hypothetical protein EDB83DRAFT_2400521 [Lactarius deliciosus]|nr:hypothetical protein EDB83DRAFT_2400521 [Lactarius deliciosus]